MASKALRWTDTAGNAPEGSRKRERVAGRERGIGRESESGRGRSNSRQRHYCEALFHCQLTSSFVFLAMILNDFGRVYASLHKVRHKKKIKCINGNTKN